MPIARLSIRPTPGNRLHNLWCNNGSWWVHYTVNWDGRKRRIRKSLRTKSEEQAIRLRDELFALIEAEGEFVPDRTTRLLLCPRSRWSSDTNGRRMSFPNIWTYHKEETDE